MPVSNMENDSSCWHVPTEGCECTYTMHYYCRVHLLPCFLSVLNVNRAIMEFGHLIKVGNVTKLAVPPIPTIAGRESDALFDSKTKRVIGHNCKCEIFTPQA